MPDFDDLYRKFSRQMEDFWSRRANVPRHERIIHVFGNPVACRSNHEGVLDAAALAESMYSASESQEVPAWRVSLTIPDEMAAGARNPGPPPERLIDRVRYQGAEDWLSIDLDEWGHCFVDMKRGEAHAVIHQSLAANPEQVCLVLLNTILTNFVTRHGYSMLHASALIRDEDILLLQAPHGTGKSTTALRLLLNGYRLLSDSMVYIGQRNGALWMGGFPIGRIKLREDMLPLFPTLAAGAEAEPVRNETKHRVDLTRVDPALTYNQMIRIRRVEYCLLERADQLETRVQPLEEDELWPEIMVNSLHYDEAGVWNENLRRIKEMLAHARLHRLSIGTSEEDILRAVNGLW